MVDISIDYNLCRRSCEKKDHSKVLRQGYHATFYYPGGGKYKGGWKDDKHSEIGVKTNWRNSCYEGQWVEGMRHGFGRMYKILPNGEKINLYVGEWKNDKKWGEGKQYFVDGSYYGFFMNNRRHGIGIKWMRDGGMYMGEWAVDVYHGVGVLFYANGNRYEGHFARGFKNGEGTFYHMNTGQIQKGMWDNDVCKTSMVMDYMRNTATMPTEYPIPKYLLDSPDSFVKKVFRKHMSNAYKRWNSDMAIKTLNFVKRHKNEARFEPKLTEPLNYRPIGENSKFPCVRRNPSNKSSVLVSIEIKKKKNC